MEKMEFCIHGHFYQPPREDPLTGEIPIEPGAAPYRNWNERINSQCYRPNALLGNFEHISFNIGPTLFQWMEQNDPETYRLIVQQEQKNLEKYGVGNGMAQAYHHTILPLASLEDKITQVRWGIADFTHRFKHKPDGMWLPESAVNDECLQVMVDQGIKYTILAPWQAAAENLDPSHPYRVQLNSGSEITVFFYNQDLSTQISFNPEKTVNAERFISDDLLPKFHNHTAGLTHSNGNSKLVMIASDGELYGHHQPFRDKFLAYLHDGALSQTPLKSVYPARWLHNHTPKHTIRIHQNSSWSCYHGVERWSGDCSCTPNNGWKEPLRSAQIELADIIDGHYLSSIQPFLDDPWELRHRYIDVILGETTLSNLLKDLTGKAFTDAQLARLDLLMRAQVERQRMFTSCGWFFEDFDRIEPRNNVAYAAQAAWLMEIVTGKPIAAEVLPAYKKVQSWRTGLRADEVFSKHLERARQYWRQPNPGAG